MRYTVYYFLFFAFFIFSACGRSSGNPGPLCGIPDGICPDGCTFYDDEDCTACNSQTGLTVPVRPCSQDFPCVDLLSTYTARGIYVISTQTDIPVCYTCEEDLFLSVTGCSYGGRGNFDDRGTGSPQSWTDADGTERYWCEFRPAGTSVSSKRPLLIYIPGSGGSANDIYDRTLLRAKAVDYDNLSGESARTGFILVSVQGRNLHWPTEDPQDGSKFDSLHRDMDTNRDVAFFDHLIDSIIDEGVADPDRIYLTGWSNGARFAAFYGLIRHENPTPGGNYVAAIAAYSGGDPFENITASQAPSCKLDPYPRSTLPFLLISRNCDAVACCQDQYDYFTAQGWTMAPGNQVEEWVSTLTTDIGDTNVQWMTIGYDGTETASCLATPSPCTTGMALRNHFCWPDGVSDDGGNDREEDMLEFLRNNPLN